MTLTEDPPVTVDPQAQAAAVNGAWEEPSVPDDIAMSDQVGQYVRTLKDGIEYHQRRWDRAHTLIENLLGGVMYSRYLAGEVIERRDAALALRDEIIALEQSEGMFTAQLDVDSANAARKKDGTMLAVKLSGEWGTDTRDVLGRLIDLTMVGGTQVTFRPAMVPASNWVQPRLQAVEGDEPLVESDTAADNARARDGDVEDQEPVAESESEGEAVVSEPDPEHGNEPTPLRRRRPSRERGASPVAPDGDAGGV